MRPRKYPLEPLLRLEKDRAEARAKELGTAIAARETAARRRELLLAQREAERARADAVRREEREALEKGELTVRDLARGGAWETRVSAEDAARGRGLDKAQGVEAKARAAEVGAQRKVAVARAEVEATARHEQRWKSAAKKVEEAREEEALAEAAPRKGRTR